MKLLRFLNLLLKSTFVVVGISVAKLWLFGGNSNNGSNCGLAYANSNNAWTNANSNISARLTMFGKNKNIRVLLLRHGKAPGHREPRRRVRMYSTCSRNNIRLARIEVSLAACGVSKPILGFERFTQKR